ncbi:MAG: hypothetical protein ABJE95_24455 [Byssovorax sp.]
MKLSTMKWATPSLIVAATLALSACADPVHPNSTGNCSTATSGGTGGSGSMSATTGSGTTASSSVSSGTGTMEMATPGGLTTGKDGNTFDHFNDPGASGAKDPFEILKERAEEGPPEVRTRLHSCTKIPYASLGDFLTSRGVNLKATSSGGAPKTAGELYASGTDALGVARFDAREGETYFHTTAGATKLFDIFTQAAPEIIANIQNVDACKINGAGKPMFDAMTGACVYESLSCIMGRPATADDMTLCNLMLAQAAKGDANDLTIKRNITVAAFLSAANTCE